ncbi:hypothetical protein HOLleu_07592 [Holothuria leucospilota]|uniref:Endonuclease/exonuclease/phosphatase domain-containing protein n=1 Tax=Holothuria leucospilota TaxID=206669 RepID=A0A9Q1CGA7_HOLLE|nr:hypothetical protein HOLleu_07592 [Holothuria leucospilota]
MLLVKNNLTPSRVSNLTDGSESIWAKFSINGTMHYVASWYRDPDAPSEHTSLLREQLSKIMANHKTRKQPCFHILGDFNFSKLHAIFKKTRKNNIHDKWAELRKKVKREVYISHTNYINGMIGDIKNDTKPFWKYINGQKRINIVSPLSRRMAN